MNPWLTATAFFLGVAIGVIWEAVSSPSKEKDLSDVSSQSEHS